MSSPLSPILGCILEFFEYVPLPYILLNQSNYFRYIDDVLLVYPDRIVSLPYRLTKIKHTIDFN